MNPIEFILNNSDFYLDGAWTTTRLAFLSFGLALIIGVVVASFRVSPVPPLQRFGSAYVSLFRNTPLLVLAFMFFFGFPKLGIQYPPFTSAVIVLGAYTGAYLSEAVRSGINSIAKGEAEAARAIGLSFPQLLSLIVIPQSLRTVVAPIGNLFIANFKNTAIFLTVGVFELTAVAQRLANRTAETVSAFLGAATIYIVILIAAGAVFGAIEQRVAIKR